MRHKLPGYIATVLLTLTTTMWTFWGVGEMYYEGWWGAWYKQLGPIYHQPKSWGNPRHGYRCVRE